MRRLCAVASTLFSVSCLTLTAQAPAVYVCLKTSTARPPAPVDGIVTATLASGAYIRVRAQDIDYDRTAAYTNRIVVGAWSATERADKASGRKYIDMAFANRYVATAWLDDVDVEEARKGFPIYMAYAAKEQARRAADQSSLSAVESRIREKCAADWADNYVMREACEKAQLEAYKRLNGGG
jgi:hypothetical protein